MLDIITVGGLINGFGVESTSQKYGLFQHIVVSMDMVLADGSLVHCSAEENADLFYSATALVISPSTPFCFVRLYIPGAHGTPGLLVCADKNMRRATPFVRVSYRPYHDAVAFEKAFEESSEDRGKTYDLVEALAYDRNRFVLMNCNFVDKVGTDGAEHDIGKWCAVVSKWSCLGFHLIALV